MTMDGCTSSYILSFFSNVHRHIAVDQCRSALTTTKDHIFVWVFGITYRTANQRHRSILLQYTIDVTAAIDSLFHRAALHIDGRRTEVLGHDSRNGVLGFYSVFGISCDSICGLLSQTAAKHTACDGAAIDVDRRRLIIFPGFGVQSCIHCTQCRTAINVVYGQRLFCVSLRTDIHFHITADHRRLTLTAAINILTHGSVGHIHLGAAIHVGGITTAIDIANGRSLIVVVLLNRHLGITCCRSAGADGRLVAAAKDIACNRGITFDGQVGLTYLTEVMQIHIGANVIGGIPCQMTA